MTETVAGEIAVLDSLTDGVVLVRGDEVVYSNPTAARLLGVPPTGRLAHLSPPSLPVLVAQAMTQGAAGDVFQRGTPARWIEATARPLAGPGSGVVVVLRDVTERRKIEAMRRDFVADASHELKTPVASIQAASETLLRALDDDPAAARRFAQQLHMAAVRLGQMVDDLLDLSRLESEQPAMQEVDLARLVTKETDRVADRAEVGGIDLVVDVEPTMLHASRKDVRLAVRNLLDNALAYTPAGGTVTVGTREADGLATISVSDTGIGIPGRDVPRIFERFYRVDDARNRNTGGTGLGLAIVRHVAEQHGGSVEVESELGRGTVFRLRFPASSSG
jgi:signal transduction histidine kinase